MKIIDNPNRDLWLGLTKRPSKNPFELEILVKEIFDDIHKNGDTAVLKYARKFEKAEPKAIKITKDQLGKSQENVAPELQKAIQLAKSNISKFHEAQSGIINEIETTEGVVCWRESRAIEKVGIYIPGGSAPLFSTILMLGIPAKIAGCGEIVLCTPTDENGEINPVILYTANLVGISSVYGIGGIQAIAALVFGTETIPKVDKIFGPGNQYVTAAKQMAQQYGTAIDMPAGPSEVLVIADQSCVPAFVAADLLSQAEHGEDSQVILLTDNEEVRTLILKELEIQVEALPRKDVTRKALENSKAILLSSISECMQFSNFYAPEHLILAFENSRNLINKITNAGSVFLGNYSCESAGDYASGTNHTLPTNGYARNYSGVSLDSFVKKITFQELSPTGIENLGPAIELMAEAEQLFAHKNAVSLRLAQIKNNKSTRN